MPVAKPEKIVIDAMLTKSVPKDELVKIAKNSDINLLRSYARLTGDSDIIKKTEAIICSRKKK